jgi:alpha-tubulin suppressor-like RCC1 family protein
VKTRMWRVGLVVLALSVLGAPQSGVQAELVARPAATLATAVVDGSLQDIVAVAAGASHTCALTTGGGVKCWGDNGRGQLGDGTTTDHSTPVDVSGLTSGVAAIIAGHSHTCALTTGGGVKCWGWNQDGQLGDGTTTQRSTPVDVSGLASSVAALAAGYSHTCALTGDGGVKCWGWNGHGQLGDGTITQRSTPADVSGLSSGITAIAAGLDHTCALTTGGGVKCWGHNGHGQLGDGTSTERHTPVDVSGLASSVTALVAGSDHTCALTTGDGVKCWGGNDYGQLGDGTGAERHTPVNVSGLTSGSGAIAAGFYHTCALTTGGGLKCWGYNEHGQLGDGTTTQRSTPVDVSGLTSGVTALAAGYSHTCALTSDGGGKCWGGNGSGQLGDGTTTQRSTPVDVSGLASDITALAAGWRHTCALTTSGGAKCWGANWPGQLGDGTNSDRSTPVDVSGLSSGVTAVASGSEHTCALTSDGGVKCWGYNGLGQLGDGTTTNRSTPVNVSGLSSGVTAIAAGSSHTCARTSGGGVKCWGDNGHGQLGDGTTTQRSTPVDVSGLAGGATALAAGSDHTCALTSGGGVKCWGGNDYGQLGDGTDAERHTPVDVSGLASGATIVAAGFYHTCALTTGGAVRCWGDNEDGKLGDGTTTERHTLVDVSGLASGATAVAAGGSHTCALTANGHPKCWGSDVHGQLGTSRPLRRLTPVAVLASAAAALSLNYLTGQPGSYFTLYGANFPPGSPLTLTVNSQLLTSTLTVSESGEFIVFLDTAGADEGFYDVTASVNPTATVSLLLSPGAPQRVQEGGGQTLNVPAGIGIPPKLVHLPLILRNY